MSDMHFPSFGNFIVFFLATLAPVLALFSFYLWRRQRRLKTEREQLSRSQARLRSLLEEARAGLILVDDHYQIVEVNEHMAQMLHYTVAEMVGSDFRSYIAEESRSLVIGRYQQRRRGKSVPSRYEFFALTREGERRRMEVSSALIYQDNGRIYTIAQVWDITEQAQVYNALARRNRQMSALYRTALELNAEHNVETLLRSIVQRALTLLRRNAGGISLYRPETDLVEWVVAVGEPLAPLGVTAKRGEGLAGRVWKEMAPILINEYEVRTDGNGGEGTEFTAALMGAPIRWGEQFLGVLTVADLEKRPFTPNDADLLSQFAAQAAIAIQNARFYEHAQQELAERRRVEQALTAHSEQLEAMINARTQTLQQRTQQLERQTEALAQAKEAAEAARAEAEAQREKAEAANRSKSQLLASVSHELRTPLNAVIGYAQILLRDQALREQQKERLSVIQESGQHLLTLINDILDLSKIEAGHMELHPVTVHISHFLREVACIVEMRAQQKGIPFHYDLDENLPMGMMADEKRLRQVLTNLLDNAVKFTEEGEIRFRVKATAVASSHYRIRFEVEDTGVGIPSHLLEQIFQPFAQAGGSHQRAQGTGLGLSISRRLVKLMGGALRVESQVEQGTLFWFELTLPVADLPVMWPKAKEGRRISGYAGATRRALVVDDDPLNRRLLQDILLELGFAVEIARGGEAAVALAEADPPDVIFMDLVMPDIGGLEAVRRLRRLPALAETVIVAVSASAFAADQERSRSVGCDDFLVKPLGMRTLQRCLQTHLELEWVYTTDLGEETAVFPERAASAPLNSFTVPPLAEMETLLDLARRGDVGGVHQWAARVKGEEDAYAPFAERLIALAQQYDEKAILALTHRHLPERPFPAPHTPEEDPDDA